MGEYETDDFDPEAPVHRDAGRGLIDDPNGIGSVTAHLYRGEMERAVTWRERLDQTTNWAVTIMAAILTFAFSSEQNPHYILLIGVLLVWVFLAIETRRYLGYDVWRSRVRVLQENLFAMALDPSQGVERDDWRRKLSEDYHHPTLKMPLLVALAHRLRRVYLPLMLILLAAWAVRITAFDPDRSPIESAAIGAIPGSIVVGLVAVTVLGTLVVTFWPRLRGDRSEQEFEGVDAEWKE